MHNRLFTCLACGGRIASSLAWAGSPRCHDCRDAKAPLRADLVESGGRQLRLVWSADRGRLDLPEAA